MSSQMEVEQVKVSNISHVKVAGTPTNYCGWPWIGGIHNFGSGELTVAFAEAPWHYQADELINHYEVEARAKVMLRRSLDHGETWPQELEVMIFDNSIGLENMIADKEIERPVIDMTKPESILYCGLALGCEVRSAQALWLTPPERLSRPVTFVVRSADKGYTWEKMPIIVPPFHCNQIRGVTEYVKMPDGCLLLAVLGHMQRDNHYPSRVLLYRSTDNGVSWFYGTTIWRDPQDEIRCSYPHFVLLPTGRLLCTLGLWLDPRATVRWMGLTYSDDGGLTWSELRRIGWWGTSPYSLRLKDGRILLIYAWRQSKPYGIRGRVSEDEGGTWNEEFIIRDDGASPDLGYPVATQLDDGRVFTAYYFNSAGESIGHGRYPRYIGGSFLELN